MSRSAQVLGLLLPALVACSDSSAVAPPAPGTPRVPGSAEVEDPSHDAGPPPVPAACTREARRCVDDQAQVCSAEGRWEIEKSCGATARCVDGACVALEVPSCATAGPGRNDCGESGNESCCASPYVPGGRFFMGSRTTIVDGDITDVYDVEPGAPVAILSSFRLDAYPATVGRLRGFVAAVRAGWRPAAGSGVHEHLNRGRGLVHEGGFEGGWETAWNDDLGDWQEDWDAGGFHGCQSDMVATPAPGDGEKRPANCVDGTAAYAFCIWDGGFLPSWTEWQYAAAAGAEQRVYPWGAEHPTAAHVELYDRGASATKLVDVGSRPRGRGAWGHYDLLGGVTDRAIDGSAPRPSPCLDCYVPGSARRPSMLLGGTFNTNEVEATFDYSFSGGPTQYDGVRCARRP